MKNPPKVVVVQRNTNVASKPLPSRSVYARLLEPFEYLRDLGLIKLDVIDEKALNLHEHPFDILVFSKHTSAVSLELSEKARSIGKTVIYDIDDFLPAFPSYSGGQMIKERIASIRKHTEIASIVTTATSFLKEKIDEFFQITSQLAPNGINVERHAKYLKPKKGNLKIVFTNADLIKIDNFKNDFFKLMNSFLRNNTSVEFDIITDPNDEMNNFLRFNNLGNVSWFEHKRLLAENAYDLAITPLGGTEDFESLLFNSCKSPIKYLEYGALYIPGIYSKTPIYENVITNNETGILVANTPEEWSDALQRLIADSQLRRQIAKNAFDDIMANHHVKNSAGKWLEIIESSQK